MAGYANRVVTIHFPDLSEEGDDIHVVMRNPKLIPPGEMRRREPKTNPDGTVNEEDALMATYEIPAKLIIGLFAYDASSTAEDQPRLVPPWNAETVAMLPMEMINAISEEMGRVNPQKPTADQEAATSRT
jgi:hypothetical protein